MRRQIFFLALVGLSALALTSAEDRIYRMCVPKMYYDDCLNLLKDPSEAGIEMECIAGRDRIDCLDMINQRKADVLATEPEDMYVAYHKKNQDYRVISEIRTKDDADADFRYEGIILIKKNSNINSLKELRGAKSCHTGFGRNVGYKIPITKLKNADILKVSLDPEITATERELKSLSEFFSQSCLVGNYSADPETDKLLKRRYSNLCALCEHPDKCDYPDKFSGYDGAIRCLDKGKGDVAFTKVQFVKKYFGMMSNKNDAEGDPAEFEYLCEDGTRRPVTGPACSWAQRPWTGYISNADIVHGAEKLHNLQNRLKKFFENGLHAQNKEAASHLLIKENAVYHNKPEAVEPKIYLEKAGYKDVIERDGSMIRKMRMCVQTDIEMSKCETMKRAAYSRDVRPEIDCVQEPDCLEAVRTEKADLTIVKALGYTDALAEQLQPIVYENYGDSMMVAIVDPDVNKDLLAKVPIFFNEKCQRARMAATFLNKQRSIESCQSAPATETTIQIVPSEHLNKYESKKLLCANMQMKPISEYKNCNLEVNLPRAVFTRKSMTKVEQQTIKHMFITLSSKFGPKSKIPDVFTIFGEYQNNYKDVLFDDYAVDFVTTLQNPLTNVDVYNQLKCDLNSINKN
jgi:hypothetical protein